MPELRVTLSDGRSLTLYLDKTLKQKPFSDSFIVKVKLEKKNFCEKCLGEMAETGTHFEPAAVGPIAGFDVTTHQCKKCGHEHETRRSVD